MAARGRWAGAGHRPATSAASRGRRPGRGAPCHGGVGRGAWVRRWTGPDTAPVSGPAKCGVQVHVRGKLRKGGPGEPGRPPKKTEPLGHWGLFLRGLVFQRVGFVLGILVVPNPVLHCVIQGLEGPDARVAWVGCRSSGYQGARASRRPSRAAIRATVQAGSSMQRPWRLRRPARSVNQVLVRREELGAGTGGQVRRTGLARADFHHTRGRSPAKAPCAP